MNLLIINLDKGIFRENSSSLSRLKEYSRLVDKIFVIVWTNKKEAPIIFEDKLFIYPTNSFFRILYFFSTFGLANRIIRQHKIDLIFTQDPFETGFAGWLISKIKKIPLQLQIHTDFLSPYFWKESLINKFRVLFAKSLIPHAKSLRVVSERIKKSILINIKYPISRIHVLPIFVDVVKIHEQPIKTDLHKKYPQFSSIILMASRLTKEKNISLAIAVMLEIVKKYPEAGLLIVGCGPEEEKLKLEVVNYELQDNIKFKSWTDDIYSYYKSADIFLLTSNYEGYGMSVVEAMAAGCPVIMTDVGAAGGIIIDNYNGMIVPVNGKRQLAAAIIRMVYDKELRDKFTEEARKTVFALPSKSDYLADYRESWKVD